MAKKKLPDLQITELYLVKADWHRTFMAQIVRDKTNDGEDIIRGSVVVNEGKIWCFAKSGSEEELGKFLDGICLMKLDMGLHSSCGVTVKVFGEDLFLN
jgi:hypothetical protein